MAGRDRDSRFVPRKGNAWEYDPNDIDLLSVKQKNPETPTGYDLLSSYTYRATDPPHLPATVTDASGQTTTYTYDTQGHVLTVTTPARAGIEEERTTTYSYNDNGYLESVKGPATGATTVYTYDGYGRVRTVTNPDSYTVTLDYDVMDRPTRFTYPDGTYEETVYNRLDAERQRDRLGSWSHTVHDALRRPVTMRDPLGRTVTQQWCTCGSLDKVIDGNGNAMTWERDLQGRVRKEIRANASETQFVYENTTSRVRRVTDAKGQHQDYAYFVDNKLKQINYPNPQNPTANVSFNYDSNHNRLTSMADGTGTTNYSFNPITAVAALGAGNLSSVDGPLPNDTITYGYDELGRVVTRSINGVSATWSYDALGRVGGETNALGSFTYGYEGVTSRVVSVTYPNGQTTALSYYPNSGDRRLQEIHHRLSGGATLSKFNYAYDVEGNINVWTQQTDSNPAKVYDLYHDPVDQLTSAIWRTTGPSPVTLNRYAYSYDRAGNRTTEQVDDNALAASYDNMNRLARQEPGGSLRFKGALSEAATVTVQAKPAQVSTDNKFQGPAQVTSGTNTVEIKAKDYSGNERTNTYEVSVTGSSKTFTYDANGNLTGDGGRIFEWDVQDRLIAVNQGTLRSEFTYDGRGRRVRIVEKDNGVVTSDTRFVWCGLGICEERDASGSTVMRRFFPAGVQDGGLSYFYAMDHLGSVREITDEAGTIRARHEYDPYGRQIKVGGDLDSTFGFTGHYVHKPSGMILAPFRAYDAELGRWISEDPIGLKGRDLNLYRYVSNSPTGAVDPTGEIAIADDAIVLGIVVGLAIVSIALTVEMQRNPPQLPRLPERPWRPPSRPRMGPESPVPEPEATTAPPGRPPMPPPPGVPTGAGCSAIYRICAENCNKTCTSVVTKFACHAVCVAILLGCLGRSH